MISFNSAHHMPVLPASILVVFLTVVAGCSSRGPQIVPIEGTVSHKGEPVPNVHIYFAPTDGRPSWAVSDANGHFKLNYDAEHEGAKVGTHEVWILDEGANVDPTVAMSGGPLPKRNPAIRELAKKYSKDSPLTVEVTKADRNFELRLD
jgi:hypothetical protein